MYNRKIEELESEIGNLREKKEGSDIFVEDTCNMMDRSLFKLLSLNPLEKIENFIIVDNRLSDLWFYMNFYRENLSYQHWHGPIQTDHPSNFGDTFLEGGLIDILFKCQNCERILFTEAIEIPYPENAETIHGSRAFGDSAIIECDCGTDYEIEADCSIADWDVNFISQNKPEEFYYKIVVYPEIDMELDEMIEDSN